MKVEMFFIIPCIIAFLIAGYGVYSDNPVKIECYKASATNKELNCNDF